ncbi:LytR/AlgR family response regulator transcription factor [Terrimonas alba]|uniref:LytR/AlgR family response regulator transcription factor n=1 Tax=Terrimonas alba TaxID=3349636 RepID=UPI0035F2BA40
METKSNQSDNNPLEFALQAPAINGNGHVKKSFSKEDIVAAFEKIVGVKDFFQQNSMLKLADLLTRFSNATDKKSFLVYKNNKYINVLTENIAFFYIKYESAAIMCFDRQEYFVNYSLDQVQHLLPEKQFFRVNRQYLINFNAVKEVEHYFARKLLVNSTIPARDKLVVPKEKVTGFLHWLDNR